MKRIRRTSAAPECVTPDTGHDADAGSDVEADVDAGAGRDGQAPPPCDDLDGAYIDSIREPAIRRNVNNDGWLAHNLSGERTISVDFLDECFGNPYFALDAAISWRNAQPWHEPSWGPAPSVNPVRRYEYQVPGTSLVRAVWYASGVSPRNERWIARFPVDAWGEEMAMHKAKDVQDFRAWEIDAGRGISRRSRRLARRTRANRNSRTGIVGVSRVVRKSGRHADHPGWPYWNARWTDEDGVNRTRTFSVRKLGEDSARQMAIETRRKEAQRTAELLRARMF